MMEKKPVVIAIKNPTLRADLKRRYPGVTFLFNENDYGIIEVHARCGQGNIEAEIAGPTSKWGEGI
jgi:hypothetical protein